MKTCKGEFIRKMRGAIRFLSVTLVTAISCGVVYGQDPVLPQANLGSANVFDGFAGEPGFVYQGFAQIFNTHSIYDGEGRKTSSDLKINSIVQINQLIYLSPVEVFKGKLAFMVLIPVVQINSSGSGPHIPRANPSVVGDLTYGTAIQWSDKKLFGKPFHHRSEIDVNIPLGSYSKEYQINPSAHLWGFSVYHAFTMMLTDKISISARNQLNLNSRTIGSMERAGAFYNGNYSVDYAIIPALRVEGVAYYLKQFEQDSFAGDRNYYQNKYQIRDTRESVFGIGPGLAYFAPHGLLFEAKVMFETDARNRPAGTRSVLRVTIPITK